MTKIGILYICLGKYQVFWRDFYLSCEQYFITDAEKHYYVVTDSDDLDFVSGNQRIHIIKQQNLGWPLNTLLRFEHFLSVRELLSTMDYLFFFNANCLIVDQISATEFLPQGSENLLATSFYRTNRRRFPYETNPLSTAYIAPSEGEFYYQGGLNGGRTADFLAAMELMNQNIRLDLGRGIIARVHDESHWNRYLIARHDVKFLASAYIYPEGFTLPGSPKIILCCKDLFGGLKQIRGTKKSVITIWSLKLSLENSWHKLLVNCRRLLAQLYDKIYLSRSAVLASAKKALSANDSRRISVAILATVQPDLIIKSLKNILSHSCVSDIVVVATSTDCRKELLALSDKIHFYQATSTDLLSVRAQALSLCREDWAILLDSGNCLLPDYFTSLLALPTWEADRIYCPSEAWPLVDFRSLTNQNLDFNKLRDLLIHDLVLVRSFLNDGNYLVNKDKFLPLIQSAKREAYSYETAFVNYLWLSSGYSLQILPDCSYYKRPLVPSTQLESILFFEELKNKFLVSDRNFH